MELYTLDSQLRRTEVVDRFESLIWTERFTAWGDFELHIFSTLENRRLLTAGTRLAMNNSYRIMTIEFVENLTDSEGRSMLKITGRSSEALLDSRAARNDFSNLTVNPKWTLTGTPGDICRQIFNAICRNNTMMAEDNIPYLVAGAIFPPGNIPEPDDVITIELDIKSVYAAIKEICDVYNLGFRLLRNGDASELKFDIYSGNDRTTLQNTLTPIVFSPELDNLTNTSEITSIANYKNVAYVYHKNATVIVYADGTSSTVEGFDRKVLPVVVTDIDLPAGTELTAALTQRGKDELSKNRSLSAFDGELSLYGSYIYDLDYQLGDLVEMRNSDGVTNQMRVAEQIFVSDSEGERAYPTLAIDLFVTPGSWFAWDYNQTWIDADGTWAEQP